MLISAMLGETQDANGNPCTPVFFAPIRDVKGLPAGVAFLADPRTNLKTFVIDSEESFRSYWGFRQMAGTDTSPSFEAQLQVAWKKHQEMSKGNYCQAELNLVQIGVLQNTEFSPAFQEARNKLPDEFMSGPVLNAQWRHFFERFGIRYAYRVAIGGRRDVKIVASHSDERRKSDFLAQVCVILCGVNSLFCCTREVSLISCSGQTDPGVRRCGVGGRSEEGSVLAFVGTRGASRLRRWGLRWRCGATVCHDGAAVVGIAQVALPAPRRAWCPLSGHMARVPG